MNNTLHCQVDHKIMPLHDLLRIRCLILDRLHFRGNSKVIVLHFTNEAFYPQDLQQSIYIIVTLSKNHIVQQSKIQNDVEKKDGVEIRFFLQFAKCLFQNTKRILNDPPSSAKFLIEKRLYNWKVPHTTMWHLKPKQQGVFGIPEKVRSEAFKLHSRIPKSVVHCFVKQ